MVTELAPILLITEWVPLKMWLLYNKYNLFYFLPKPMWFFFSLPKYYLYFLKIKVSSTIKDWFPNRTKIRKKCCAKLSKWIANRMSRTVNSNPVLYTFLGTCFAWYKECIIWQILFCTFSDVLPPFTCARATDNLWSTCLELHTFICEHSKSKGRLLPFCELLKWRSFSTVFQFFYFRNFFSSNSIC